MTTADVNSFGPITQGTFLMHMGLQQRLNALLTYLRQHGQADKQQQVFSACQRLVDPAQMGTLFKVLCIAHRSLGAPVAFDDHTLNLREAGGATAASTPKPSPAPSPSNSSNPSTSSFVPPPF
jgi:hypothetical protein